MGTPPRKYPGPETREGTWDQISGGIQTEHTCEVCSHNIKKEAPELNVEKQDSMELII